MSAHQRQRILALLMSRRGEWIPSTEFSAISLQYGARILELRADGHLIVNRVIRTHTGGRHGYFKLCTEREAIATRIGRGETVPRAEIEHSQRDDAQPELFDLGTAHKDEN